MKAWEQLMRKFDAMKSRERAMVFAAGAVVIAGLGYVLVIDGAMTRQKIAATNAERHRADLDQLQRQNAELTRLLAQDPNTEGRKHVEQLQQQIGGYDSELRHMQQGLVPPDKMVKVLEDMLSRESRVRLVKLRSLPAAALVERAADGAAKPAQVAPGAAIDKPAASTKNLVYKHGLELTVEGNYLDLAEYQARLEKLPWRMFFARTSVNSLDYPRVLMTVTLYTLSLDEAWLVV